MRPLPPIAASVLAALALLGSSPVLADAQLVSGTPAAGARATNVRTITLDFSEALNAQTSGVDIVMTTMPGMANHAPMKVSGFRTSVGPGGKTMTITLPRALPAGTYDLRWHAVTADTHRIEGSYSFSVR